jgi:hypothetical protein
MSRVRTIAVVVMSLLVGGVVFEVGRGQADPWGQPAPPAPPAPPRGPIGPLPPGPAPKAPKPPKAPKIRSGGISISIHGGKLRIDGLDQLVAAHLQNVQNILANHPNLPKDVRDKLTARVDRVKAIVDRNVKQLDLSDPDKLGDQIEKMGDELEKALEGLDADLAQLGKLGDKMGKDLAKDIQRGLKDMTKIGPDPADPDDPDDVDDADTDDDNLPNASVDPSTDDLNTAVDQLKNFALKPAQKDQIARMTADADAKVASERQALELASQQLETALADVDVTPAIVEGYVDRITKHEAEIRKTRLLTWVRARNVLDPDQRKQLEAVHRTK